MTCVGIISPGIQRYCSTASNLIGSKLLGIVFFLGLQLFLLRRREGNLSTSAMNLIRARNDGPEIPGPACWTITWRLVSLRL